MTSHSWAVLSVKSTGFKKTSRQGKLVVNSPDFDPSGSQTNLDSLTRSNYTAAVSSLSNCVVLNAGVTDMSKIESFHNECLRTASSRPTRYPKVNWLKTGLNWLAEWLDQVMTLPNGTSAYEYNSNTL